MPAIDRYPDRSSALTPTRKFAAITPSDSADLAEIPKALWVSAGGTLALVAADDEGATSVAMGSLAVGTVVPVRPKRVLSTGTTATVIGLY